MRSQNRDDEAVGQHGEYGIKADPLILQPHKGFFHRRPVLMRKALAVFRKIGEQGEQHEPPDKVQRIVQTERAQPPVTLHRAFDTPKTVDAGGADIFGLPEQFVATIGTDNVAEHFT